MYNGKIRPHEITKKYFLSLMLIYFFCLIGTIATSGCAAKAVQSEEILKQDRHNFPPTYVILNVPFIEQKAAQCGPATLAMAMQHAGRMITVEEIAPQVMTPDKKGTLQQDMISAARRNGLMAVQLEGLEPLLAEISRSHPVIVFENLSVSWMPKWHYAIVFGYDLDAQTVTLHSGPEKDKVWNIKKFERSWMLGDYWGLIVLPPDQIAITAGEHANLASAAGLEQAGFINEAEIAYETILKQWPHSLGALIGLGNVAYNRKDYRQAVNHLKKATELHPQSPAARHNLGVAINAAQAANRRVKTSTSNIKQSTIKR